MEVVTLKLPGRMLSDAARVAAAQDVTIGHLVRVLLAREIERRLDPKTPNRPDGALVAALQALLAKDLAEATGWDDLAARLRPHGYALRPAEGDIALHKSSCGTRVCRGSELGYSYRTLVRRFRSAMPGHPNGAHEETLPDSKPLNSTEKGRIQRALEPIFKTSEDWETLIVRLNRQSYELRPMGCGLAIFKTPQGRHVCDTAAVGYRYRALVKRFGSPMPGHPHGADWFDRANEAEESFDVIERT